MMERKLYIIDPGFTTDNGHHFSTARMLQHTCTAKDIHAIFFASYGLKTHARPEQLQTFAEIHPVLTDIIYSGKEFRSAIQPEGLFLLCAMCCSGELLKYLRDRDFSRQHVLFHTCNSALLYAAYRWLTHISPEHRPDVLLNVQNNIYGSAADARLYALALRFLRQLPGVTITASNKNMADLLCDYGAVNIPVLPLPLENIGVPPHCDTPDTPVFGLAGGLQSVKNSSLLPEAIQSYLEKGGVGQFRLQLLDNGEGLHALIDEVFPRLAARYPERITLVRGALHGDAYVNFVSGCDCLLLPYDPVSYRYRISQIAIESAALNVSCITSAGSSLEADLLPWNNGSIFLDEISPQHLCDAMLQFEGNVQERRRLAAQGGAQCRAFNNADVYFDMIYAREGA